MLNWIQIGIAASITAGAAWTLHSLDVYRIEDKQRAELSSITLQLEAKCKAEKKLTEESNGSLHKNYSSIEHKRDDAKRLQSSSCIGLSIAGKVDAKSAGGGHAAENGIETDWLRDYAADCERYRQERIALEDFINKTWESHE